MQKGKHINHLNFFVLVSKKVHPSSRFHYTCQSWRVEVKGGWASGQNSGKRLRGRRKMCRPMILIPTMQSAPYLPVNM